MGVNEIVFVVEFKQAGIAKATRKQSSDIGACRIAEGNLPAIAAAYVAGKANEAFAAARAAVGLVLEWL